MQNHLIFNLRTILIFALVLFPSFIIAQNPTGPKTFNVIECEGEDLRIDGVLDDALWQKAQEITLDYETNPGNNIPAEVKTILRIGFSKEYLYYSFEVFDPNPRSIRAIINDRDKLDDNDYVSLFLDPFNDSRRAFFFDLNPLGVQQDGIYDEQVSGGDLSWDAIWNSAGRTTDQGYIVEAAIPFKSLRFPNTEEVQTWKFIGIRVYPRSIRKLFHSMPVDQDNNCLLCQANQITGFKGIKPGRNLEFTPTVTVNKFDERTEFPDDPIDRGQVETNVGLDARWGITTDLTLNLTLNPDFSQVEADAAQLDVNNRFALQFPEKRPFFLEGADFFNTPLQAFFSRTIVDPSYGAKITGKIQKNAVGLLVARDQVNNLILPGFQGSQSTSMDQQVDNVIARFRRDIGKNSNVGLLYTGREGGDYFNRVGGMDFFVRPWDPITIRAQYLRTSTLYDSSTVAEFEQPENTLQGESYNLQIRYDTRNWNSRFIFENRNSEFRADAGFVPQVDYRRYRFWVERMFWPKQAKWYSNFGMNAGGFGRQSTSGTLDMAGVWTSAFFNGPLQLNYWINPDIIWQQYEGTTHKLVRLWTGFDIQPLGNLGINGWINFGPAVDFANSRKADNLQFRIESDIRVGRHVDMTINHRYLNLHLDGDEIFTANLTQWQAAYNFNPRTFFRIILQYRNTVRNPELFEDSEVHRIDQAVFAQLLLSYKLNPQSVIFLGYVDNHQGWEEIDFRELPLTQLNQTLFFKIGYAWRP
ncbi:MAG: carbohydrate binding family 9 domain-containing protein [bacterium]|nr:carbohydrate binding family 9 domain-containing protein [bacterium]